MAPTSSPSHSLHVFGGVQAVLWDSQTSLCAVADVRRAGTVAEGGMED